MTSNAVGDGRPADRAALRGLPPTERDAQGRVRHAALTDADTQLPNRLHFDVVYRLLWEAGGRGIPVTLLRFDLPGFGLTPPDYQTRVGERLNLVTRQMDMIARLSEDRFAVLLMDCNASGGVLAAERFETEMAEDLTQTGMGFRAGLAAWKEWMVKPDDLMIAAEEAMAVAWSARGRSIEVHRR